MTECRSYDELVSLIRTMEYRTYWATHYGRSQGIGGNVESGRVSFWTDQTISTQDSGGPRDYWLIPASGNLWRNTSWSVCRIIDIFRIVKEKHTVWTVIVLQKERRALRRR
jgi:hypothetical protein